MTKIPVDYAYEEIWKVSERREDKKMESEVPTWMWALLGVSIGLLLFALFKPLVLPASNPDQAHKPNANPSAGATTVNPAGTTAVR